MISVAQATREIKMYESSTCSNSTWWNFSRDIIQLKISNKPIIFTTKTLFKRSVLSAGSPKQPLDNHSAKEQKENARCQIFHFHRRLSKAIILIHTSLFWKYHHSIKLPSFCWPVRSLYARHLVGVPCRHCRERFECIAQQSRE